MKREYVKPEWSFIELDPLDILTLSVRDDGDAMGQWDIWDDFNSPQTP